MFKLLVLGVSILAALSRSVIATNEVQLDERNLRKFNKEKNKRSNKSIVDLAAENSDLFSSLVAAVQAADFVNTLECSWGWCYRYTVFAPTNEAFEALAGAAPETFAALTEDPQYGEHLRQLLEYHLLLGNLPSRRIDSGDVVHTIQGGTLEAINDNDIEIISTGSTAKVIQADIKAKNGIIHALDTVLLPAFVSNDIPGIASNAEQFSTLVQALSDASLVDALSAEAPNGPFTVFAPTNEAFEKVDLSGLTDDELIKILTYHVVPNDILVDEELEDGQVTTLAGEPIDVEIKWSGWRHSYRSVILNDGVDVTATNILASNGIIHEIDQVLIPPSIGRSLLPSLVDLVTGNEEFSILAGLLSDAGLVSVLQNEETFFTVFAPTNDAFEQLLEEVGEVDEAVLSDVLLYHVLAGVKVLQDDLETGLVEAANGKNIAVELKKKGAKLNGDSCIEEFDIEARNGVIHVIDKVLIPKKDIAGTAKDAGVFETLLAAVNAAGLADTLASGTFTLFAPTDDAFEKLPEGLVLDLLNNDLDTLGEILKYHLVEGFVPFRSLEEGKVPTVQGQEIDVDFKYHFSWKSWQYYISAVFLNRKTKKTKVTQVDIFADNGVIHVIDEVLLPPN